ncbi:uncharacterized protein TrAtP1_005132 [Trichoderma atroviride]|uniref:uncharacterized protein n=1 Tax=Hypocrea atroviridis TaxID=63577 RepID=UPI00331F72D3|nr:hypothetical protein TrAtP1_005132 [Trichoderma atroviride]
MAEPPSSPPSEATGAEDALSWYKAQYELLESELAEFRESSRELEQELEKDIERAEKQERVLKDKADSLRFEVEEWKRKYKDSKSETAAAQASLEKEITSLRDANRTLALRLRDSEVANDDFERQARNTTSSLEDMESKFNQAVERGVLMEEEIKMGEQEREALRIESQRLREELSELKIEAELMQDKAKKYERHSTMSSDLSLLGSPHIRQDRDGHVRGLGCELASYFNPPSRLPKVWARRLPSCWIHRHPQCQTSLRTRGRHHGSGRRPLRQCAGPECRRWMPARGPVEARRLFQRVGELLRAAARQSASAAAAVAAHLSAHPPTPGQTCRPATATTRFPRPTPSHISVCSRPRCSASRPECTLYGPSSPLPTVATLRLAPPLGLLWLLQTPTRRLLRFARAGALPLSRRYRYLLRWPGTT